MKRRPWDIFKEKEKSPFKEEIPKDYLNDPGFEIPEKTLVFYPMLPEAKYKIKDVIEPLLGHPHRDWFGMSAFSFCLPLTIANQYGFVVKAAEDLTVYWEGGDSPIQVESVNWQNHNSIQPYVSDFGHGILTLENKFIVRTPPGVNLMTMQPPNHFIPGLHVMAGVVESDNLRRNFTFNMRVTTLNTKIKIKKGDWLAAFMPVPRHYADMFTLVDASTLFPQEVIDNEMASHHNLGWERHNTDKNKLNGSGRRYFKGLHVNETRYKKHQKRAGLEDLTDGAQDQE